LIDGVRELVVAFAHLQVAAPCHVGMVLPWITCLPILAHDKASAAMLLDLLQTTSHLKKLKSRSCPRAKQLWAGVIGNGTLMKGGGSGWQCAITTHRKSTIW
jgi:hypothetical protein